MVRVDWADHRVDVMETLTVAGMQRVVTWAIQANLSGVHYWAYDRDKPCPSGASQPLCNTNPDVPTNAYLDAMLDIGGTRAAAAAATQQFDMDGL